MAKFKIGQQFMSGSRNPVVCTVVDIYTTYDHAGNVVKIRYVADHEFAGQIITDYDVNETSIAMRKM